MKLRYLWLVLGITLAIPVVSYNISYWLSTNRSYHDPDNAWKCKWIEPVDPADKRACAAIPDKWNGEQMAACMIRLWYGRECPDEVKP